MTQWVFLNPQIVEGNESQFNRLCCNRDFVEEILAIHEKIRSQEPNGEATISKSKASDPIKEAWLDLGGMKPQKTTRFVVEIDDLKIHCEAKDVSNYVNILKTRKQIRDHERRNHKNHKGACMDFVGGKDCYVIPSFHLLIHLTNSQCEDLLSKLEKISDEADETAKREWPKMLDLNQSPQTSWEDPAEKFEA